MDHKLCPYCHTDSEGYTQSLPRSGNGKAFIWHHHPIHGGWALEVTQLLQQPAEEEEHDR